MADHVLETRFWLSRPRAQVFEFFADPRHLALVQPGRRARAGSRPPPGGPRGGPAPPHRPAARGRAGTPRPRAVRPTADRNPVRSPRAPAAGAPRWLISWARLEAGLARSPPARTLVSPHHRVENCRFEPIYVAKI